MVMREQQIWLYNQYVLHGLFCINYNMNLCFSPKQKRMYKKSQIVDIKTLLYNMLSHIYLYTYSYFFLSVILIFKCVYVFCIFFISSVFEYWKYSLEPELHLDLTTTYTVFSPFYPLINLITQRHIRNIWEERLCVSQTSLLLYDATPAYFF